MIAQANSKSTASNSSSLSPRFGLAWPLSSIFVVGLIIAFAIFFSALAVQQHRAFLTNGLDLGNVDQALWNTAQGRFLQFTLMTPVESRLALHVEPILLFFVPFYWLNLGGPELLLITQATIVALGAWPIYQITLNNLLPFQERIGNQPSKASDDPTPSQPPPQGGRVKTSPPAGETKGGEILSTPNLSTTEPSTPNPQSPVSSLQSPVSNPQSPISNLQSPIPNPQSPISNPQSPTSNLQSPISNLQSPIPNPQSPIPNLQSPTPLLKFSILNSQFSILLAYLLLPTLQSAVLFDFHAVTMAPTFLLFAFLALERHQSRRFLIFAALAMACKEDMPLVVAMLGLYIALAQRRWGLAAVTMAFSLSWFGMAFFVIQPQFAAGGNIQLDRYAWLGSEPISMLMTLVTQPALVLDHLWTQVDLPYYLFNLFFPTAFLALLSPLTLIPMLPTLAINLLSDNPFTWRLEDFHYGAPLAPFLFISTIYGMRRLNALVFRQNRSFLSLSLSLLLLTCTLIYHYHRGYTPLAQPFIWPIVTDHHQQLKAVLTQIPSDVPTFAQSNLAPHLAQRQILYSDFGYFTDPQFPAPAPIEAIVLDITTLENIGGLHQFLKDKLFANDNYQLISATNGILYLTTNPAPPINPSTPSPQSPNLHPPIHNSQFTIHNSYPLPFDFGNTLRLHTFSLHFNRQEEIEVTVELEALQPLEAIQPVLYLLDADGQPVGATTDLQPTLVWYPVEQWPVGERVRLRFNTLPWHTRSTPAYRLALGVITGDDPWDIASRQPPLLRQPTELALRRPAEGTLLELARIEQRWSMPTGGPLVRQFEPPGLPNRLDANFSDQIRLLGYTDLTSLTEKTETVSLTLVWQAITQTENLVRFVQLVGPDGLVYGQQDSAPDNGHYPPSLWQPGEVVVESVVFSVQADRPPGEYALHIGWYDPNNGERLPLEFGGDHVRVLVLD